MEAVSGLFLVHKICNKPEIRVVEVDGSTFDLLTRNPNLCAHTLAAESSAKGDEVALF